MTTLLQKIQADAVNDEVRVSTLLRKVKLAAHKLGLEKVEDWLSLELNGYDKNLPPYRMIAGTPMLHNPRHGWQALGGATELLSTAYIFDSVAEIEELIEGAKTGAKSFLHVPLPDAITADLNQMNGVDGLLACQRIGLPGLVSILDKVRNMVLDWAMGLEKEGIHGGENDFDEVEKAKAQNSTSPAINIGTIHNHSGAIGVGHGITITNEQGIAHEQLISILGQLKNSQEKLPLSHVKQIELTSKIQELDTAIQQNKPHKLTVIGLVTDIRSILNGAAGNIIAAGFLAELGRLF